MQKKKAKRKIEAAPEEAPKELTDHEKMMIAIKEGMTKKKAPRKIRDKPIEVKGDLAAVKTKSTPVNRATMPVLKVEGNEGGLLGMAKLSPRGMSPRGGKKSPN